MEEWEYKRRYENYCRILKGVSDDLVKPQSYETFKQELTQLKQQT